MAGTLIGALRVSLGANTAQFEEGMTRAQRKLKDTSGRFEALNRQAARSADLVKGAFAGIAGVGAIGAGRAFLRLADEAKSMAAQLQLATAQTGSFGKAQEDVARIATTTRESLSATTTLYGNFMRASEALGARQSDAARATETFGKALKIGGADANAAASATLQFGQALASGALRGDEFNSIAEASPRIVRLIGEAMGVTQGQVRALAAEGKLTSDVLFRALTDRKFTAGIDSEFAKLPVTFDQAMTLVQNAAVTAFGAFDEGGQFSTALANFVSDGAAGFASLANAAREFGIETRAVFDGLDNAFDPLGANGQSVLAALGIKIQSVRDQIAGLLGIIDTIRNTPLRINQTVEGATFGLVSGRRYRDAGGSNLRGEFLAGYTQSEAEARRRSLRTYAEGEGIVSADPLAAFRRINGFDRPKPAPPPSDKPRPGSTRRALPRSSADATAGNLQRILDGLLPDDARIRELTAQADEIGKAFAAKLIPVDVYARAKRAVDEQLGDLVSVSRQLPSIATMEDDPAPIATPIDPAFLGVKEVERSGLKLALEDIGLSALDDLNTELADAVLNTKKLGDAFAETGDRIVRSLIEIAIQQAIVAPLANAVFGGMGGGGSKGNWLAGGSGSNGFFGGFRAAGGPITPNNWYVVGERGPEVFAPGVSGTIIPNGGRSAGAGGGVTLNQTIQFSGAVDIADRAYVREIGNRAAQNAVAAVREMNRRRGG